MPGEHEYERYRPEFDRDPVPTPPPRRKQYKPQTWGRLVARKTMAQIAVSMVGQHYVRGAKGARPGQRDGARVRPGSVKLERSTDARNPAFLAGSIWVEGSTYICGGIYSVVGRVVPDHDKHTREYLASQTPKEPGRCFTEAGLTPRRIRGEKAKPHVIAWAESCDGWRHFDCIGLVEFAVDFVTPRMYGGEIYQWASPSNVLNAVQMDEYEDPVMDGDLVSRVDKGNYHHIGMLYLSGGRAFVAQAEDTNIGVTNGKPYYSASWSGGRWRLPDSMLFPDEEVKANLPSTDCWPSLGVPSREVVAV